MKKIRNIFHDESGVSVTEYGLVLLMIATILVGVLGLMGTTVSNRFVSYANKIGS